ncbi:hypothetical protein NLJ89_g344 [Agrocybe chaxingu]|uniref:KOW domain-containing protein n=1 Tax=Agrocybe chaxingu TaxID=84603 RepID=A0A9W8N235_9AGAR|nr:hypothetical protein NLJ89_g344 [Agrocybe chaxingu]
MQAALLEIHDRVRVVRGTFRGLLGSVISLGQSDAEISLPSLDLVETLPACDLRKAFAVGDSVVAISGQHEGMKGWIVKLFFGAATIMNMEAYREVPISLDHLQFHEEWEASTLKDLAWCSTLSKEDRRRMKQNPNQVYVGKRVMVVGKHAYKGAAGVVKDTTLRGDAMVELAIFNFNRHERISLGNLCIRHGHEWAPIPAGAVNDKDSGPPEPPFLAPITPNTPFPAANIAIPATPAWNPNSRSPLLQDELRQTPVPAWLADPRFGSHRVKLLGLGTSSTHALEFRAAGQGAVTVRDGMAMRSIPLDDVRPLRASRKEDTVVCTALGPHFAHVFRIKAYAADACIVRPFGAKAGKGEKLFSIETNSLAEVFPPQAAVLSVARP